MLQNKSQEDISDLGQDLVVDLFGGKSNDTLLSSLRHIIFTKKVASWQLLKHLSLLNGFPNITCNKVP